MNEDFADERGFWRIGAVGRRWIRLDDREISEGRTSIMLSFVLYWNRPLPLDSSSVSIASVADNNSARPDSHQIK